MIANKNTKIVQDNECLNFSNMNFFCAEGTGVRVSLMECFQQEFVRSSNFWVLELMRVNCVYEFSKLSSQT